MNRYLLGLLVCIALYACGQRNGIGPANNKGMDAVPSTRLYPDTGIIAILSFDKTYTWISKDATKLNLSNEDMNTIEQLLGECLKAHNATQDSTRAGSDYIDLNHYKRQYLPFTDKNGERKVFINCFCNGDWDFDHWKKYLVQVHDGGSCFFHLFVNLSKNTYEPLSINGEG